MTTQTLATLGGLLAIALDVYAIVRAISRDHGVERTLAWIFAIITVPVVGALSYLALASPGVRGVTRRRVEKTAQATHEPSSNEPVFLRES